MNRARSRAPTAFTHVLATLALTAALLSCAPARPWCTSAGTPFACRESGECLNAKQALGMSWQPAVTLCRLEDCFDVIVLDYERGKITPAPWTAEDVILDCDRSACDAGDEHACDRLACQASASTRCLLASCPPTFPSTCELTTRAQLAANRSP